MIKPNLFKSSITHTNITVIIVPIIFLEVWATEAQAVEVWRTGGTGSYHNLYTFHYVTIMYYIIWKFIVLS